MSPSSRESQSDSRSENAELGHKALAALKTYRGVVVTTALIIVLFSVTNQGFFSSATLTDILETNAVLLIVSLGLTFPMIAGGFDLSVAGIVALSGVCMAKLTMSGTPLGLAIAIVIIGSVLFGALINGVLIGYLGLNFFIVTLGSLSVTQGLALEMTAGNTLSLDQNFLAQIGGGQVGFLTISSLIGLVILLLAIVVMRYTGLGRSVYAVGGNPEAAQLAGLPVAATRLITYAIASGLAGVGGVIEAGRLASAGPTTDSTIELTAAAAVLIGGTAFGGGVGTMLGTLLGVVFLGVLQDGLLVSGISSYWQGVITGVVLIISVFIVRERIREGSFVWQRIRERWSRPGVVSGGPESDGDT